MRARQNIYRAHQPTEQVCVICSGWAFAFSQLHDGRRQIVSILLPGDPISAMAVLTNRLGFSVQAITDLRYCLFDRVEVTSTLRDNAAISRFAETATMEKNADIELAVDLGQCTAEERIARLVLRLMNRLRAKFGLHGNAFEFPLRQQHIADACGLTTVHVGRVFTALRERGVIVLDDRRMHVLDYRQLAELATG